MGSGDDGLTFFDLDDDAVDAELTDEVGRFAVGDEIARGGLGRVHEAYDRRLEREVAIKALLKTGAGASARFERETLLTARLQHPNIIPVYDGGTDATGQPYLAMRLVHGGSLAEALEKRETLTDRLALLPAVIDVCHAVAYAHSQRIAHRDLKPDNILVGGFGETVVIDWGLAKDLDAQEDAKVFETPAPVRSTSLSSASLTHVGSVVGTPAYMPPEQARGEPVDEHADVYALGAVLYHALVGKRPYAGMDDVLGAVLEGPPPPAESLVHGIPPDLVAIVRKAMAREPADRYDDAQALAADLDRFQSGRFVGAYAYTPMERAQRFVRQHPVSVGLSVLLVLCVVVGVALLAQAHQAARAARDVAVAEHALVEQLREEERRQLDASRLAQARAVVASDPAEALRLLGQLSDGHPFGGDVRTLAAWALAERPPHVLLESSGDGPLLVATDGARSAIVRDGQVWLDGERVVEVLDFEARRLHLKGDRITLCGSDGVHVLEPDGLRPVEGIEACSGFGRSQGDELLVQGEKTLHVVEEGEVVQEVALPGPTLSSLTLDEKNRIWVSTVDPLRLFVLDGEARQETRVEYQVYGMAVQGDAGLLLSERPPLAKVSMGSGGLEMRPLEVDVDWLEVVVFLDERFAVVGGASEEVFLVDVLAEEVVQTLGLPGLPRALVELSDGAAAVATDDGSFHRLELRQGRLSSRSMGRVAGIPHDIHAHGEGVVFSMGDAVYALDGGGSERHVLAELGGRPVGMLGTDEGVLTWGAFGVQRVGGDGTRETVSEEVTLSVVSCGETLAMAQRGGIVLTDGRRFETPGLVRSVYCDAERSFLLAGLRDGGAVAFDLSTGELRATAPASPALRGTIGFTPEPDGRVLVLGWGEQHYDPEVGVFLRSGEGTSHVDFVDRGDEVVRLNGTGRLSVELPGFWEQGFAIAEQDGRIVQGTLGGISCWSETVAQRGCVATGSTSTRWLRGGVWPPERGTTPSGSGTPRSSRQLDVRSTGTRMPSWCSPGRRTDATSTRAIGRARFDGGATGCRTIPKSFGCRSGPWWTRWTRVAR